MFEAKHTTNCTIFGIFNRCIFVGGAGRSSKRFNINYTMSMPFTFLSQFKVKKLLSNELLFVNSIYI